MSGHQDNILTYGKIGQLNDTRSLSYFSWCCCFYLQSGPVKSEPLYVIEALLNCSSKSVKSADGETPMPCGPDEKGEMQVSILLCAWEHAMCKMGEVSWRMIGKIALNNGFMLSMHLLSFECTQEVDKHEKTLSRMRR